MRKIPAFFVVFILLIGFLITIPTPEVNAEGASQYHFQTVQTFMEGEAEGQRTMNLTDPSSKDEQTVDCPPEGNERFQDSQVGTWESKPAKKLTRVAQNSQFYFTPGLEGMSMM